MTEGFSLEKTKSLARKLAGKAQRGDCYCLSGDLGSGKTEFARAFIQAYLGKEVTVSSPTFNILQIYEGGKTPVYHFDLYRLKHALELEEIGLGDAFGNGITLIEWPELVAGNLPDKVTNIKFEIIDDSARKITIS